MVESPENQPQRAKSPQEELDELLRQSAPQPTSGIKLPESRPKLQINWLGVGVAVLAIVLVIGTGYVLLRGVKFSTGELLVVLNQDSAQLAVDGKSYGQIASGDVIRLKVGQRTLNVTKDGFLELTERVEIARGQQLEVSLQLLPIPTIEQVLERPMEFIRLNQDGSEIAYFDSTEGVFKTLNLETRESANLFRGSFSGVQKVVWSPVNQVAMVTLSGRPNLPNMLDNRAERGRYIPLGERPTQGEANFSGATTWLFDDNRKTANGWQPILLNESVRQTAFNSRGDAIIYIYDTADGEYSLVQSWPDGMEWERLIVEMPRLQNPEFFWGPDDRYVIVQDTGKLMVLDLVAKTLSGETLADYLGGSQWAFSTDGTRMAYLATAGATTQLKIHDLLSGNSQVLEGVEVGSTAKLAWVSSGAIIVALENQTFMLVDIGRDVRTMIPFVGTNAGLNIQRIEYSLLGKVLMLVADTGVFIMRV